MESVRQVIFEAIKRIAKENNLNLKSSLENETVLLDSGLDSLGFAILVAELGDILDLDPFVLMEEPVYPNTLGEFIEIYERYSESEG